MIEIKTDFENNSENFWSNIHALAIAGDKIAQKLKNSDSFFATDEEAKEIRSFVESIEGWDEEDAAEFAQHPLLFQDLDSELEIKRFTCRIENGDTIKFFIDNDTEADEIKKIEIELLAALSAATDRDWEFTGVDNYWHPTGDSDEVYRNVKIVAL